MDREVYVRDPWLIIWGALNLNIYSSEAWGFNSILDRLASYFNNLFSSFELVNVQNFLRVTTWVNSRAWDAGVEKILDRFFISKNILM